MSCWENFFSFLACEMRGGVSKAIDIDNFVGIASVGLVYDQGLLHGKARVAAPGPFDQDHIGFPISIRVDQTHALGLNAIVSHGCKEVHQAEGAVDEVAAAVGNQQ